MKIAIKYGLLITLVVVVWVLVTHFLFHVTPDSKVNTLGPILFNLASIIFIYLGIKARSADGQLSVKEGIKTGLGISLVYAIASCLFFVIVLLLVGTTLMANEPMAQDYPMWQVALGAFAALFFGALILGLVYSTVISFMLLRSRKLG